MFRRITACPCKDGLSGELKRVRTLGEGKVPGTRGRSIFADSNSRSGMGQVIQMFSANIGTHEKRKGLRGGGGGGKKRDRG